MSEMNVLHHIEPTDSFSVWDYESIAKYVKKAAVYVFWDQKGFEKDDERHNLYAEHSPVYIGKTSNLAKRIIEHLTYDEWTEHFSIYFYHVDVYVFEDLPDDHALNIAMNEDKLCYENLADLYEVYLIIRRFPWFNDTHNFYVSKKNTRLLYFSNNYHELRRSEWCDKGEIEYGFKQIEKMAKVLSLPVQTIMSERWLRIEDFVDQLIKNRKNKIPLGENLIEYFKKIIHLKQFNIKTLNNNDKNFKFFKEENNQSYIASDALLYYKPSKRLIKQLSKR